LIRAGIQTTAAVYLRCCVQTADKGAGERHRNFLAVGRAFSVWMGKRATFLTFPGKVVSRARSSLVGTPPNQGFSSCPVFFPLKSLPRSPFGVVLYVCLDVAPNPRFEHSFEPKFGHHVRRHFFSAFPPSFFLQGEKGNKGGKASRRRRSLGSFQTTQGLTLFVVGSPPFRRDTMQHDSRR